MEEERAQIKRIVVRNLLLNFKFCLGDVRSYSTYFVVDLIQKNKPLCTFLSRGNENRSISIPNVTIFRMLVIRPSSTHQVFFFFPPLNKIKWGQNTTIFKLSCSQLFMEEYKTKTWGLVFH